MSTKPRTYLTPDEFERILKTARKEGRQGIRDGALLLVTYRHGLRCSEAISLKWHAVDFRTGQIHISRLKSGTPSVQPIQGPTIRALRELRREFPDGEYLFQSERKGPLSPDMVARIIGRAAESAKIGFPVNPHMLRHSCGYKLANDGQDTRAIQAYLGHRNIQHTVQYTALSSERFRGFWQD
jgi:type 1 fimbriae regulatory protein FimB/type 1 fimbriae regulatory protein FimE